MRSQIEAADDAKYCATQLITALQDADAPEELIDKAEELQSEVSEL